MILKIKFYDTEETVIFEIDNLTVNHDYTEMEIQALVDIDLLAKYKASKTVGFYRIPRREIHVFFCKSREC